MRIPQLLTIAAVALVLTGCPYVKPTVRVGMVVNMPIADSLFNATAWHGLEQARDSMKVDVELYTNADFYDYDPGIQYFVDKDVDMIVTVGFPGVEATQAFAEACPDIVFVCVDHTYNSGRANLAGAGFDTYQAAFLAGYLAAGMTQTNIVGVMGGMDIPPVNAFMQGLAEGAALYTTEYAASVQVIGGDTYLGSFDDVSATRLAAEDQLDAGADILMVASGDGARGAAAAVFDTPNALYIGVDVDWYLGWPEYGPVMLTSIMKHLDAAVFEMVARVVNGTFDGADYIGTLANGGVGIAPFHDFEDAVPEQLKEELEGLRTFFGAKEY